MSNYRPIKYVDITIRVTGGSKSESVNVIGELARIAVIPPGVIAYDLDLSDGDGYGIDGISGNVGGATLKLRDPVTGKIVVTIANAGTGVYTCRLAMFSGI